MNSEYLSHHLNKEENEMREINNSVFQTLVKKYLLQKEGKWILISEGNFVGIYDDRVHVLKIIKEKKLENKQNFYAPIKKQQKNKKRLGFGVK